MRISRVVWEAALRLWVATTIPALAAGSWRPRRRAGQPGHNRHGTDASKGVMIRIMSLSCQGLKRAALTFAEMLSKELLHRFLGCPSGCGVRIKSVTSPLIHLNG